uniref:Uncharacterized protein n=1 Tax=Arundo donax TaxID=35708 RepID=A0A0A8ZPN9_ARUDO
MMILFGGLAFRYFSVWFAASKPCCGIGYCCFVNLRKYE